MADQPEGKDTSQTALLLAIQDLKLSVLAELRQREPLWWKVSQVALPVVLTSVLGALVWLLQSNMQAALNSQSTLLKTQLGFAQYVYEQRLDAYKKLYDTVLEANASAQDLRTSGQAAGSDQAQRDRLQHNLVLISELYNANKLIATKDLNALLAAAWPQAAKAAEGPDIVIQDLVDQIVQQMRKDLLMDQLSLDAPTGGRAPNPASVTK